ncbi:hypothetical protein [Pyrococcus kukulkanii]|uniref:Uncharacterized protein n=1 Tax=Pyrococcus kukulkanii TaxID=1609559 RepID=A0A127B9T8_9EURY|nr:hypothetical protein [Pyrococcus kukulkanii]AMM54088.1 hypothetical protein TQ32_06065 [Pyrococcus kukulkanii]
MEKPNVEILEAVLREGLYWAYLGRPKEVMAFLRGKLKKIANSSFGDIEEVLKELEEFYEEISRMDAISQKEFKKLEIYRDMLLSALEYSD